MINFLKYKFLFFIFSGIFLLCGIFSILKNQFVYSIDFVGGGVVEFLVNEQLSVEKVQKYVQSTNKRVEFETREGGFLLRGPQLNEKTARRLSKNLEERFKVKRTRFELVGPRVGKENIQKTLLASFIAVVIILIYCAFTFKKWSFAYGAVVALIHDVVGLLGVWSFFGVWWGVEFDLLFVTALLTTMSFSVHDTIVIFDKIKEERSAHPTHTHAAVVNTALSLTMMRSINNSFTILIMLSSLIILGGASIKWFATALFVGTVLGTYSSPFIATPVYYFFEKEK